MSEPSSWRSLKRVGNLPVPWIVKRTGEKVWFGIRNLSRMRDCGKRRLCAVCGSSIIGPMAFAGGVIATNATIFNEPPMHEACLLASLEVCPYLRSKADPVFMTIASSCLMNERLGSIAYHARNVLRVSQLINPQ